MSKVRGLNRDMNKKAKILLLPFSKDSCMIAPKVVL
jgi:hypothetical protein